MDARAWSCFLKLGVTVLRAGRVKWRWIGRRTQGILLGQCREWQCWIPKQGEKISFPPVHLSYPPCNHLELPTFLPTTHHPLLISPVGPLLPTYSLPTTNDAIVTLTSPPQPTKYTHILDLSLATSTTDSTLSIHLQRAPSSAAPVLIGLASQLQRDETPRQASSTVA